MSKSAKKRERLLRKAEEKIIKDSVGASVARAPGQGQSRSARRRRNRRQGGMAGNLAGRASSLYLASLKDPFRYPGAKIPDSVTLASSTFSTSYRITLTPGTGGDGCGTIVSSMIGDAGANTYVPIHNGNNTTPGGNFTWNQGSYSARASVQSMYQSCRPVSGALRVVYTGTTSSDSGVAVFGYLPGSDAPFWTGTGAPCLNTAQAMLEPYTTTVPLRDGGMVLWHPADNSELEYRSSGFDPQEYVFDYPSAIFVMTSGMAAGTSLFVDIIFNWEGIPATETLDLVTVGPSISNSAAMDAARNWFGNLTSSYVPVKQVLLSSAQAVGTRIVADTVLNYARGRRGTRSEL